ncbi:RING finger protein 122 [Neoarius graeffei]|uniref:RING finger protein 122 n=1 Tax=Neoarius graeffei TaxID=443677 RepID=UPI00298C336F|nr:RING finger protein 122 [Neoarius graeffei]
MPFDSLNSCLADTNTTSSTITLITPKLQHQAQSERLAYKLVVLKDETKNMNIHGQTCTVCLEDFRIKDELVTLPCQHGFHERCLLKWLEVCCICPVCNKPIGAPINSILDELV